MAPRLAVSAVCAVALVWAAIFLARGLLPQAPPPEQPLATLELVEPLESERIAAAELREFLSVAPARRFREAAAEGDLRPLAVGDPGPGDAAPIPGTVIPPLSQERADLVERARDYARAYNLLVQRAEQESRPELPAPTSDAAARSPERTAPSAEGATR